MFKSKKRHNFLVEQGLIPGKDCLEVFVVSKNTLIGLLSPGTMIKVSGTRDSQGLREVVKVNTEPVDTVLCWKMDIPYKHSLVVEKNEPPLSWKNSGIATTNGLDKITHGFDSINKRWVKLKLHEDI